MHETMSDNAMQCNAQQWRGNGHSNIYWHRSEKRLEMEVEEVEMEVIVGVGVVGNVTVFVELVEVVVQIMKTVAQINEVIAEIK